MKTECNKLQQKPMVCNIDVLREVWLTGNLLQNSSKVRLANRPDGDGDYKESTAAGMGSPEMAKALRDRAALRGNITV